MRDYEHEGVQPETALEAIQETYDANRLTTLFKAYIGTKPPPTRKAELAIALAKLVEGDQLRLTWESLSPREKAMSAQTAWSDGGLFDKAKFNARQSDSNSRADVADDSPDENDEEDEDDYPASGHGGRGNQQAKSPAMDLVMPRGVMPRDVQRSLRRFVPKPTPPTVGGVDAPPETVEIPFVRWNKKTKSYDRGTEGVPLVCPEMERAAPQDLMAVLRLVDAGKVSVTEKNRWPTAATMRQIAQVLVGGDYYPDEKLKSKEGKDFGNEIPGPIRAFAWPLLLQAGKLAQVRGYRLELIKAGRAALLAPAHETLHRLWQAWVDSNLLDELRRISVIRGQTGNGKRHLTQPSTRRRAIAGALCDCPMGRWVSLDDFSRHMIAADHRFDVTSEPWSLYIVDQQYGSLGYQGYGGWNILQFRYLLCFLMEYAATLGLVDIAFVPPAGAQDDFGGMWGTDDLAFFSRYDGLLYLRLTAVGAYALGLIKSYTPPPLEIRKVIRVEADLRVVATEKLASAEQLQLDTFAQRIGPEEWQIDPMKILDAEAGGRKVAELIAYLNAASGASVPESVKGFIVEQARRAGALRDLGPARLIGSADAGLLALIANDPVAGKLCSLAGPEKLVVAAKDDAAFHRALRAMSFVLRRPANDR
jgi:hypothetical protein